MRALDCPFVFVLWIDAVTRHGWVEIDEADEKDNVDEVWSSGFMTQRTKEQVRLVSDAGTEGGTNRRIAIPFGMIQRIHADSMTGPILFERKARGKAKQAASLEPPTP